MSTSSIYKELSNKELEMILKQHFDFNIFEFKILSGGMFNTTYYVKLLPSLQEIVLRLGPINRHLLLPFEYHLMDAEVLFNSLCKKENIPVSTVLACDTTKKIIDRDYMIVSFIKSSPLSSLNLSKEEKGEIYKKVGYLTSKFHNITNNKFGRLSSICNSEGFDTWGEYILNEINQTVERYKSTDILSMEEILKISRVFNEHIDLLNEIKTPYLVHADLWEGNILINTENNDVCAIIDGDRSVFGDIDFEFASGWMINEFFTQGYGKQLDMNEKNIKRRNLYSILYNLIDAFVCLVEYNNESASLNNKNAVIEKLNLFK